MFRLFLIPLPAIVLFVFFTAQSFAEEQGRPVQVKVFKSPG
jgi:hypothetical protein